MRTHHTTPVLLPVTLPLLLLAGCDTPPPPPPVSLTDAYPAELCGSCAEWNRPHAPFRIHENSYYVGTEGLAAILITSPEGHVLIDGGLPDSAPLIEASIRELGFDIADVGLILNSHAHFDHAGGIAALQQASGARVVASPWSASAMRAGNSGAEDPQDGQLLDFPPPAAVEELTYGEAVTLGPLSLIPHSTPAHTPGGTSWSWRACEGDDCLDLIFADSQTAISVEGFRFSESADLPGFEAGFARLEALPCHILITPHPGASALWERWNSPDGLLDPTACRRYADSAREMLRQRLERERGPEADAT